MYSPQSQKLTVGAMVRQYTRKAKTVAAAAPHHFNLRSVTFYLLV
jgi:hypothetical protein